MTRILPLFGLLLCTLAPAQSLALRAEQYHRFNAPAELVVGDSVFFSHAAAPTLQPVALVTVVTQASQVLFDVSDQDRKISAYELLDERTDGEVRIFRYVIATPGKHYVDVIASDFEKQIFDRKQLVVEVAKPEPEPEPEPEPGPEPAPDGPYDGLAARVRVQAKTMNDIDRQAIAAMLDQVIDAMVTYEIKTFAEATNQIQANWPRGTKPAELFAFLVADSQDRELGWQQAIEYYRQIVEGVQLSGIE